jgi:hypothetical protein
MIFFLILIGYILGILGNEVILEKKNYTDPISVYDGHLVMNDVVTIRDAHAEVDKDGYLNILNKNSQYTSFSFDVGFNRAQTSLGWHGKQKDKLYIVGVEANARLVNHFEHSTDNNLMQLREHTMVIHAAAGTKGVGFSKFNPGFGWANSSDTGSLFGFKDKNRENERKKFMKSHLLVRNIRLDSILKHIPKPRFPDFVW